MQFIPVKSKTLVIQNGVTLMRVKTLEDKHKLWFEDVKNDAYIVHNGEIIPISNGKVFENEILVKIDHKRIEKPDPRLFQHYQNHVEQNQTNTLS